MTKETAIGAAMDRAKARESKWTNDDKLACAERELRWRYKVYQRRVESGQMSADNAKREISIMESIAADYRGACEKERLL
jgi:hypothetical protein